MAVETHSERWSITAFVFLVVAWVIYFLNIWCGRIIADEYGPAPDVIDALGKSAYVNSRVLVGFVVVVALDVLAMIYLIMAHAPQGDSCRNRLRLLALGTTWLLAPSLLVHLATWQVTALFL